MIWVPVKAARTFLMNSRAAYYLFILVSLLTICKWSARQIHKNIFNGAGESLCDSAVNLNDLMTTLPYWFCQCELDFVLSMPDDTSTSLHFAVAKHQNPRRTQVGSQDINVTPSHHKSSCIGQMWESEYYTLICSSWVESQITFFFLNFFRMLMTSKVVGL